MWRPKNWRTLDIVSIDEDVAPPTQREQLAFEAGADAMLRVLANIGCGFRVKMDKRYTKKCIDKIIDFTIRDERKVTVGEIWNFLDKAGFAGFKSIEI